MFFERVSKLRTKVIGLVAAGCITIGLISIFSLQLIGKRIEEASAVFSYDVEAAFIASNMNLRFKRQVQEWKNILLRGHTDKDREKYWKQFLEQHEATQNLATKFSGLDFDSSAKAAIAEFQQMHQALLPKYQSGYELFISSGFDHKSADSALRGIDREPSRLLEATAASLLEQSHSKIAEVENRTDATQFSALSGTILGAILVSLIAAVFINLNIVKPITALIAQLWGVSRGQYDESVILNRSDELGKMSKAIELTRKKLLAFRSEMDETMASLDKVSMNLESSSAEITATVDQQNGQLDHVSNSMDEMAKTSNSVSANASDASVSADAADTAVSDGGVSMSAATGAIQDASDQVSSATDVIKQLEHDASTISSVLDVINTIAEQTNLLALNAAIEAARAGDQGRGFAVVADEVRTLAQRTQASTTEIQDMISLVQTGAQSATSEIEKVKQQSEISQSKVDEVHHALQNIANAISDIRSQNTQTAAAAEEQAQVTSEVAEALNSIKSITQTTVKQAHICRKDNETLNEVRERLTTLISTL